MAFLDNSGDIILDAVLTDAGRQRLSRGSFKITKFALGDEEINYETFNGTHPSGSAFYDLVTLQTPILEAFTNNTSMMKSRLMTITRNNILYLPIFKLNNRVDNENATRDPQGDYILLADLNTQKDPANNPAEIAELARGVLRGHIGGTTPSNDVTNHIAVDQGIDSEEGGISFKTEMPNDLVETAFILRADHRLLHLHNISNNQASTEPLTNQFIDDDGIAHYYVALGDGSSTVEGAPTPGGGAGAFGDARRRRDGEIFSNPDLPDDINEAFRGPLGSILRIYPRASLHVEQSSVLFDEIGTTVTSGNDLAISNDVTLQSYKYIDTLINVVGVTTGYSIDIPIRIVKKT
tara:strand:- start:1068 stop:2117 length:1050 start_codon:yes stop_codon:yes gene_type:complete